jgi:acetyl-CoA carboxylase biotin carboxylase subunit
MSPPFGKILIANRGEIAIRVMRACRELGIESVAVFSEVDRTSKHVRYADEAWCIGPAQSTESYLRIDKIIDVAKRSGCQAIHPGYGFLAENPQLPKACMDSDIVFIGPSAESMTLLGDKTEARKMAVEAGIPVIPGISRPIVDSDEALGLAEEIGYPVLLKAAGGGGGKGVRIVEEAGELRDAFERATAEAAAAFNNPDVFVEKFLVKPRHVEFQVLADGFGNAIHLNERECSVQRRFQKLVEESPSCALDDGLRSRMGATAIQAVKSSGYANAGTVEFLLDAEGNYYFCEVNARLQVEHPVTELVTGIDLVKEQIYIAAGERLRIDQDDVGLSGASIECRICAEDPVSFLPSIGTITELVEPAGPGVRLESGISEGSEITMFYDPLIAKLLVWGSDREEAMARMRRALEEYKIKGIQTTIPFHIRVLEHGPFLKGNYNTGIVKEIEHSETDRHIDISAMAAAIVADTLGTVEIRPISSRGRSRWKMAGRMDHGIYRQR